MIVAVAFSITMLVTRYSRCLGIQKRQIEWIIQSIEYWNAEYCVPKALTSILP